jgi:hypothetical protein
MFKEYFFMSDSKIQAPSRSLMKKFINDLKHAKPNADVELIQNDVGDLDFSNMVTQGMWLGYQLGYKQASRNEPGWFFLAKATNVGMEISPTPRGNCNWASATQAAAICKKKYGGKFFAFSLPRAAYSFLKDHFRGNPNIDFSESGEISGLPFNFNTQGSVKTKTKLSESFIADATDPYTV